MTLFPLLLITAQLNSARALISHFNLHFLLAAVIHLQLYVFHLPPPAPAHTSLPASLNLSSHMSREPACMNCSESRCQAPKNSRCPLCLFHSRMSHIFIFVIPFPHPSRYRPLSLCNVSSHGACYCGWAAFERHSERIVVSFVPFMPALWGTAHLLVFTCRACFRETEEKWSDTNIR